MNIKNPRTPIVFYIITALIFVMLLNTLIVPTIVKRQIVEVDYGTFLRMIENKQVEKVQVEETQIHFYRHR
jgi:cell division protease FtsH